MATLIQGNVKAYKAITMTTHGNAHTLALFCGELLIGSTACAVVEAVNNCGDEDPSGVGSPPPCDSPFPTVEDCASRESIRKNATNSENGNSLKTTRGVEVLMSLPLHTKIGCESGGKGDIKRMRWL